MATTITRAESRQVGTSTTELYKVPAATQAIVKLINITNVTGSAIVVQVEIYPLDAAGNQIYIRKDLSINANSTAEITKEIGLIATDSIQITSDSATSADCWATIIEDA